MSKTPQTSLTVVYLLLTVVYLLRYRCTVTFLQLLFIFQREFVASGCTDHKTLQKSAILVMSTASSWTWRVRFPSADVGVPLFTDLATEKQDSLDAQRETWPWSAWASANLLLSITALNQQDMYKELMCKQKSTDTYTVVSYRLSSSNPQVKAKNRFLRAAFSRFNRGEVNFFFW